MLFQNFNTIIQKISCTHTDQKFPVVTHILALVVSSAFILHVMIFRETAPPPQESLLSTASPPFPDASRLPLTSPQDEPRHHLAPQLIHRHFLEQTMVAYLHHRLAILPSHTRVVQWLPGEAGSNSEDTKTLRTLRTMSTPSQVNLI